MYMSDERPVGVPTRELSIDVRLDGHELDRKLTALRAMATQTTGIIDLIGADTYAAQVREETYISADRVTGSTRFAQPVGGSHRAIDLSGGD